MLSRRLAMLGGLWLALCLVVGVPRAGAYAQPGTLNDGHDYSNVCPPRPGDATSGADESTVATVTIAQELADACVRNEQLQGSLLSHVQGDADQAHADARAIESAIASNAPPGSQTVTLAWPTQAEIRHAAANATQAADNLHGDLWVLAGILVGCFLMGQVLRRVFT